MRRPKLRTVVYLLVIAILAVLNWRVLHPREPSYQGKPLSVWLDYYYSNDVAYPHPEGWEAAKARAEIAIRKMGTNSLPALIKMISSKEYALKQTALERARMEQLVRLPPDRDNNSHWRAVYAF